MTGTLRPQAVTPVAVTKPRVAVGAHPRTGWTACAWHSATTVLTQACALTVACLIAPLPAAAVRISAVSHAVIDRRWIVQAIVRAKHCYDWVEGPYLSGQSLHHCAHVAIAVGAVKLTVERVFVS